MMKQLQIPFITGKITADLSNATALLNNSQTQQIDNLLWSMSGYKPEVSFQLVYTANSILLKYNVCEKYVQAVYREINDPVYKDSCVEFFIAFGDDIAYYNFEFNCVGTALVGYGEGKIDRINLDKQLISKIKTNHSIKSPADNADELITWELVINIPFSVFLHHDITSLKDKTGKANFYKCGDDLPEPHFLSWNNIDNAQPNFHLSAFFGSVYFS